MLELILNIIVFLGCVALLIINVKLNKKVKILMDAYDFVEADFDESMMLLGQYFAENQKFKKALMLVLEEDKFCDPLVKHNHGVGCYAGAGRVAYKAIYGEPKKEKKKKSKKAKK